jgi:hypothetical protein
MQGHSVIRLLGRVIMLPLGAFMDCKYTSAKNVNFGMGLLDLISVDSRSNHLESFILDGFSWVFFIQNLGSWIRQEPWAFDEEVIDITENLLTCVTNYCHIVYCFGNILKKEFPCLNL